jgi:hypothetical protein
MLGVLAAGSGLLITVLIVVVILVVVFWAIRR